MKFPLEILQTLRAEASEVSGFLEFFESWADEHEIDPRVSTSMGLMLDEWLTNIAMHAYAGASGPVEIRIAAPSAQQVDAWIVDAGPPFDPLQAPAADTTGALEDRQIGGLGIHFIRRMANRFEYERTDDRNRVHFGKGVPGT